MVRACVIFNPAAKGQKAERFRKLLDTISKDCELKQTSAPGDARLLAARAVNEGFDTIFAAGGDGTLNEVLNGIADVPDGFDRARLGVSPLGTINVFARELGIPLDPAAAWDMLRHSGERRVDLPYIETGTSETRRFYFAQLAGAGLDARAIQLVNWPLKKKLGPLAYVVAGLKAMAESQPAITVSDGNNVTCGQLVLIGNGRLYGGTYRIFPDADFSDGYLDVCVFPKLNWLVLFRCGLGILCRGRLPEGSVVRLRTKSFTMTGNADTAFEVDGELAGRLPVSVRLQEGALRVLAK